MSFFFISFDAFGPYQAGGIIDAIIDRFEHEGVTYTNTQVEQGDWNLRYPAAAQEILDDEVNLQRAKSVTRLVPRLEALLSKELKTIGTPLDLYLLAPMTERLCEELDLHYDLCANCSRTFPSRGLSASGHCLDCQGHRPCT